MGLRIGTESIGRFGAVLLVSTGVVAAAVGLHGWAARHAVPIPNALGSHNGGAAFPGPHATPSSRPAGQAHPSAKPGTAAKGARGPLLRSMPYARYAYQIYPGRLSVAARQALAGLKITVHRDGADISMTTAVNGGPVSAPHYFAGSDHVYVVESALGDDSNATDYNLGDDGLVVTDAKGRIVK